MSLTKESVVVITGAASGIGRALAIRIAREPIAGMAIADVNADALAETARLIADPDLILTQHVVDVADEAAMTDFAAEVVKSHGRASHLINNAGVALGGSVRDVSLDDMRWLMSINFWGVVHGTKAFLPYLDTERSAHIVNLSSLFGIIAPPGQATYCASKFAVRGFTESLRHELAGTNIAVSTVHPGGTSTNIANAARIGEYASISEQEIQRRKNRMNRNLSTTKPAQAAEIILKGIKNRNPRIIIGPDARLLSVIGRLFPRRYFSIVDFISGGRLKDT